MTTEQIKSYKLAEQYKQSLAKYRNSLTIKKNAFRCDKHAITTEHELQEIHDVLYNDIIKAFDMAKISVDRLIERI
jgi:hypothetical protein